MGTVQKGMPHKCYRGKSGRVYSVTQHAVVTVINKQGQDWIWTNIRIDHIKHCKSRVASWKVWKKMIGKRRKPKRKVLVFNWSLLHPEKHTLWESMERSLSCWNSFPMNSWHDKCKKIKDLGTVKNTSLNSVEMWYLLPQINI